MVATARQIATATVPALWPGETVVCLGGGPSLTQADVDACRGRARVIAVNDAYRMAPWADVLYGCDAAWWNAHKGVTTFSGLKYSLEPKAAIWPGVQILRNAGREGLCLERDALCTGSNSGYQAINLAVHLGAIKVVLLGYDMQATNGKSHWFGEHPSPLARGSQYSRFRRHFATLPKPLQAAGVTVVNASRVTALTAFPCLPLEEALS